MKKAVPVGLLLLMIPNFSRPINAQEIDFREIKPATVISLFKDERALEDLETTKVQRDELKKAHAKFVSDLEFELLKAPEERDVRGVYREAVRGMFKNNLLPHQQTRLLQLLNQRVLIEKFDGSYPRLLTQMFAKKLNLNSKQSQELYAVENEMGEELRKEIKKFQTKVDSILKKQREDALSKLTIDQKKTVKESLGDKEWGLAAETVTKKILETYIKELEVKRKNNDSD